MSENHSGLSELKSVFNPLFSAKIRVLFLSFSNLIIRQFIGPIIYMIKENEKGRVYDVQCTIYDVRFGIEEKYFSMEGKYSLAEG